MTTNTYKHFRMVEKQVNTNIHSNTERTVSPSIFKKTATLIFFVVTATTLFLHERTTNTSGQSNHICRRELKDTVILLNKQVDTLPKDIWKTIEDLNNKLPKEEDLNNLERIIRGKINEIKETPKYIDLQLRNYIFECLSLSPTKDQEEFKTKINSGPLKSVNINDSELEQICDVTLRSNGDNTKTLKTIFELLANDELTSKEIEVKEALVTNFLIGLVDFDFSKLHENHVEKIKGMFVGGNKNKELLKEWSNSIEEMFNKTESVLTFANSLSLDQEGIKFKEIVNALNMIKSFNKLYYDCLDSLIFNDNASGIDKIIEVFSNNNKNDIGEESFNYWINLLIEKCELLKVENVENTLLESLIVKFKENIGR